MRYKDKDNDKEKGVRRITETHSKSQSKLINVLVSGQTKNVVHFKRTCPLTLTSKYCACFNIVQTL